MVKEIPLNNEFGEILDYGMVIYMDDRFKIIFAPHINNNYHPYIRVYSGKIPYYIDDIDTKMTRLSLLEPIYIPNILGDQNLVLNEEDTKYLSNIISSNNDELIRLMRIVEKDSTECPKFINDNFKFPNYLELE